jgi:phage anti-repressor protein
MTSTKMQRPAQSQNERTELLVVQQGEHQLYDARLLHKDLKIQTKFEDWIKRRIADFKFEMAVDYFSNLRIVAHSKKPITEYLLTLDMAKELAMLERNEVGRQVRRYFIAKERELRAVSHLPQQQQIFKGLKAQTVNGRKMYPYRELLQKLGYNSTSGGCSSRVVRYPQHFVKMGNTQLITAEFALHLHHSKQVYNNRAALKAMQPVLPFNFAEPLNQGGSYAK